MAATMARHAAPAGAAAIAPGEIRRLGYPLRPGATWDIRTDPHFWSEVEKSVSLVTPAGRFPCRAIRISNEFLGPRDVLRAWYGRVGYLGYEAVLEEVAVDQDGHPIGTLVTRLSETLTALSLVGPGGQAALHHQPGTP